MTKQELKDKINDIAIYQVDKDEYVYVLNEAKLDRIFSLFLDMAESISPKKTHNYNQTKKDHCEYCGVKEGMWCKDGCEAMAERYQNKAIDQFKQKIEELRKEI